ncbi:MAG TPA: hypothetical protein PK431_05700, partial [Chitinophagales bacterium]|nr:hypothetical protein [Chitinophagales bacterium]
DGSKILLNKLSKDWDPFSRFSAVNRLYKAKAEGDILTGLIYIDEKSHDLHDMIGTVKQPLNTLTEKELCPGNAVLESINQDHR